jgi:hypothetical protein
MRHPTLILLAAMAIVVLLAGCSAAVAGNATAGATPLTAGSTPTTGSTSPRTTPAVSSDPGGTSPPTSSSCPAVYADPSIAFEPPLADGTVLRVGDTGWIHMTGSKDDVTVTGTPGAVSLADRSVTTFENCETSNSVGWVEVTGEAPGTVTLTVAGDADAGIRITVRES